MQKYLSHMVCLLIIVGWAPFLAFSENYIYWSDTTLNQILRSNRDGSSVTPIINLSPGEKGESLAVDDLEDKIYWSSLSFNRISRANLNGTNKEVIVPSASFPVSIQIDPLERKIYWASSEGVFRINMDGTGQPLKIINQEINDSWLGLAINPMVKQIFLSQEVTQNLTFGSYNGPFPATQITFLQDATAKSLAIDISNSRLYWGNVFTRKIFSSSLTNPQFQLLLNITGIGRPESLAVDFPARFVYWSDSGNNRIVRTDISSPSEVILTNSPSPKAIALDCGRFAPDSDNDGTPNCLDSCPSNTNKTVPGVCGCNLSDLDSDKDNIPDCIDGCPNDIQKISPGLCGCGLAENDDDQDSVPDCLDGCPIDNQKTSPGICGCGLAENDDDLDGIFNCFDDCPSDTFKSKAGACGCGQLDQFAGDGSILCSKFRILSPITKIIDPPQVLVRKRSVTITMERFAAVSDKNIKTLTLLDQRLFLEVRSKKKTKTSSRYSVFLNSSSGVKGKRLSAQSKRNTLTLKNLTPGEYSVRYRVEILKNDKIVGKTNRSPVTKFLIN